MYIILYQMLNYSIIQSNYLSKTIIRFTMMINISQISERSKSHEVFDLKNLIIS